FTSLKKLRPQSVTSRIQPGSDVIVCAEMDEQWGYVGAKSRQRWLFYAYDSLRKTVVAHVFGEPGIFCAIHTYGRRLNWHPHVHVSVTCGGLNKH
ncbi:IS1 family transposase, partial [Escherichia coli]